MSFEIVNIISPQNKWMK